MTKPRKIKNKLVVYALLVLSVSLLIIGYVSSSISNATIYQSVLETNASIAKQTMENIDFVLRGIERETINGFSGVDFNEYLRQADRGEGGRSEAAKAVARLLTRFSSVMDDVEHVFIVSKDGLFLTQNESPAVVTLDVLKLNAMLERSDGRFIWSYVSLDSNTVNRKMIGASRAIADSSGVYQGFILVLLKETTLESFYPKAAVKNMLLVDESNVVISSNSRNHIGNKLAGVSGLLEEHNYVVSSAESDHTRWRMYTSSPRTSVLAELADVEPWAGPIFIFILSLLFGFIVFIVDRLFDPLQKLNDTFRTIHESHGGDLPDISGIRARSRFMFLNRFAFKTRLAAGLTLSIMTPVIAVIYLSYNFTYRIVESKAVEVAALNAEQIKKRVESHATNLEKTVYYFYYDERMIDILKHRASGRTSGTPEDAAAPEEAVDNVRKQKRDIVYIDVYGADMRPVFESDGRNDAFRYLSIHPDKLSESPWLNTYKDEYNDYLITFARRIADVHEGTLLGYLFITFREADLRLHSESVRIAGSETYLINRDNVVMSHENKNRIGTPLDDDYAPLIDRTFYKGSAMADGNGRTLVTYFNIGSTGWRLVHTASLQFVDDSMRQILLYDLLVLFGSVLAIGAFIVQIAGRISRPINELTQNVVRYSKLLTDDLRESAAGDEVEQLKRNFYLMMMKLDTLIKEVYEIRIKQNEAELRMKEAELTTLQAQINPHFLYNTLEIIRWKSIFQMDGINEVSEIVSTLSDYFRISLSEGRRMITIAEELEHIGDYVKIMRHRYREKIEFSSEASREALVCLIPKITLQPIVENAIYHGIMHKEGKGCIRVHAFAGGGRLVVEVTDDGIGMDAATLALLRSQEKGGYGLKNIQMRLKMQFGDDCRMDIDSSPGDFTRVRIEVPAVHYE